MPGISLAARCPFVSSTVIEVAQQRLVLWQASYGCTVCRSASGRGGQGPEAMEEVEMVVLRYSSELRGPGCMHLILEAVSAKPPYLLENRSGAALKYRQVQSWTCLKIFEPGVVQTLPLPSPSVPTSLRCFCGCYSCG